MCIEVIAQNVIVVFLRHSVQGKCPNSTWSICCRHTIQASMQQIHKKSNWQSLSLSVLALALQSHRCKKQSSVVDSIVDVNQSSNRPRKTDWTQYPILNPQFRPTQNPDLICQGTHAVSCKRPLVHKFFAKYMLQFGYWLLNILHNGK